MEETSSTSKVNKGMISRYDKTLLFINWLLEKAGWKVMASEKWTAPISPIGIRPLLRKFTPRYYIVYAERAK